MVRQALYQNSLSLLWLMPFLLFRGISLTSSQAIKGSLALCIATTIIAGLFWHDGAHTLAKQVFRFGFMQFNLISILAVVYWILGWHWPIGLNLSLHALLTISILYGAGVIILTILDVYHYKKTLKHRK